VNRGCALAAALVRPDEFLGANWLVSSFRSLSHEDLNPNLRNFSTDIVLSRATAGRHGDGRLVRSSMLVNQQTSDKCHRRPAYIAKWGYPFLQLGLRSEHMSITQAIIAVAMLVVCIAAAAGLMRLFDVKGATPEQTQAEVERLLAQVNKEVKVRRRVRAGAPTDAVSADFRRFSSFSETCRRIPSA